MIDGHDLNIASSFTDSASEPLRGRFRKDFQIHVPNVNVSLRTCIFDGTLLIPPASDRQFPPSFDQYSSSRSTDNYGYQNEEHVSRIVVP
jgi:hypothetical protein